MSGFNRQHLGNVKVLKGSIVVIDPYVFDLGGPYAARQGAQVNADAKQAIANDEGGGQVLGGRGVAFATPFADGEYPVFANYDAHGNITSIEIKLDEDAEGERTALEDSRS